MHSTDHVEEVLRLSGERPLERGLHRALLGRERDLRIDERVVRVDEEVLHELASRFELDAEVARAVGVLERDDRLRARDDHALDRLVEVLVEHARRHDAPAAREQLPAAVDVLNQGALQIGIAADGAAADDVGELELRQLAELRPIDRRAVAEREGSVRPQRMDEVDAGEDVGVLVRPR